MFPHGKGPQNEHLRQHLTQPFSLCGFETLNIRFLISSRFGLCINPAKKSQVLLDFKKAFTLAFMQNEITLLSLLAGDVKRANNI